MANRGIQRPSSIVSGVKMDGLLLKSSKQFVPMVDCDDGSGSFARIEDRPISVVGTWRVSDLPIVKVSLNRNRSRKRVRRSERRLCRD